MDGVFGWPIGGTMSLCSDFFNIKPHHSGALIAIFESQ